jgi:transcriptional regulator with XRE-family HTH domain
MTDGYQALCYVVRMNTDTLTLNERARREIRAELARQQRSQASLARQLGWSRMYLSNRLTGAVAITLGDLEAIAWALGVPAQIFIRDHLMI